ncbi:polysaccharide deacetylase family protein [bacterium]|nr:polysaccharide deacetylase family protein [bacterium]
MAQEITVSYDCRPAFAGPARYTLTMLGLIAGYRPRFVRGSAQLHYGSVPREGAAWLPAAMPAQEQLLHSQPVQLAPVDDRHGALPFLSLFPVQTASNDASPALTSDLVAAAFYFLSLHEQWSSDARDQFDRFPASASLLGGRGELLRPVLAEYAAVLSAVLSAAGTSMDATARFCGRDAAVVMTHDIDYLSKFTPGLLFREVVKNFLFNRRHVRAGERIRRLKEYVAFAREEKDPYVQSIYNMLEHEQHHGVRGSWLFKAGGRDKRDVSYRIDGARATRVLSRLREAGHDIGLHPSFHAHADAGMLHEEARRLSSASGTHAQSIRQHYLRFLYPRTWRQQVEEGFEVDSTLGFAEHEGFRNGSCHPFLPWDLERGEVLPIWEVPLTMMDGTLAHYRGKSAGESVTHIEHVLDTVHAASGVAVLLFHNTAYDAHDFPGWDRVFERSVETMGDGRFFTGALPDVVACWLESAGYGALEELLQVINTEPG